MNKSIKFSNLISVWEFVLFWFFLLLNFGFLLFYFKGIGFSLTHKGIKFLNKKNFIQAQTYFEQAIAKQPLDPLLYLNLALSQDLLKAPNKSLKNYDIVSSRLTKSSDKAKFFSLFNKGELNGRLNQLDQALENYQKALGFQYQEKKIKTNIELLFHNKPSSQNKTNKKDQNKDQNKDQTKDQNKDQKNRPEKQNQNSQSENTPPKGTNKENEKSQKLSETQQKAILEEVEKQESKTRARFYKMKKTFGDKTQKDW